MDVAVLPVPDTNHKAPMQAMPAREGCRQTSTISSCFRTFNHSTMQYLQTKANETFIRRTDSCTGMFMDMLCDIAWDEHALPLREEQMLEHHAAQTGTRPLRS